MNKSESIIESYDTLRPRSKNRENERGCNCTCDKSGKDESLSHRMSSERVVEVLSFLREMSNRYGDFEGAEALTIAIEAVTQ